MLRPKEDYLSGLICGIRRINAVLHPDQNPSDISILVQICGYNLHYSHGRKQAGKSCQQLP